MYYSPMNSVQKVQVGRKLNNKFSFGLRCGSDAYVFNVQFS